MTTRGNLDDAVALILLDGLYSARGITLEVADRTERFNMTS